MRCHTHDRRLIIQPPEKPNAKAHIIHTNAADRHSTPAINPFNKSLRARSRRRNVTAGFLMLTLSLAAASNVGGGDGEGGGGGSGFATGASEILPFWTSMNRGGTRSSGGGGGSSLPIPSWCGCCWCCWWCCGCCGSIRGLQMKDWCSWVWHLINNTMYCDLSTLHWINEYW